MALSSTPFLADDDDDNTSMDFPHPREKKSKLSKIFRVLIIVFACWGVISVLVAGFQLLLAKRPLLFCTNVSQTPKEDPYRPDTLEAGRSICDCGKTIAEAKSRGCIYDSLATAWLPAYCRDDELTAQFDHAGPGENGAWSYFKDEKGTIPLNKEQIGNLGETGGTFWASRDWHIAHCLFYWQKYTRMRETGAIMEERFDNIHHVKHCTHLATKKPPGFFFLIEVPVMMNSSLAAALEI